MRSKTSYFNAAIFSKTLSRFYLLALLYLAAVCMVLPLVLSTSLANYGRELGYELTMLYTVERIYDSTQLVTFISFFGAPCAAMAIFSYLYSARSANMMGSLPVRREAMFISGVAAVYAVVIASDIIAVLLAFAVTLPKELMLGKYLIEWLLISLGQFTLFFGLAALCAVLTGSILAMPAIYLCANFAVFGLGSAIQSGVNYVLYGARFYLPDWLIRFSPIFWLNNQGAHTNGESYADIHYTMTAGVAWYAAAGAAMLVIAFFVHRARRMETAGDVMSIKLLRPVFKVLLSLGVGVIGGLLFMQAFLYRAGNEAAQLMACFAVFAIIGYVAGDMIVRRSTRILSLRSVLPGIAIAAVLAAGIWAADADVFGVERFVPEPSEVETAYVTIGGQQVVLKDADGIGWVTAAHQSILDNRNRNEYRNDSDYTYDYYCNIVYNLADGREVRRNYDVAASPTPGEMLPETEILDRLMNSPEGILSRKELYEGDSVDTISSGYVRYTDANGDSVSLDFTAADMRELYTECIVPDMRDGTIGLYGFSSSLNYEFYDIEIEIYFFDQTPEVYLINGARVPATADASIEGGAHQGFYTYATPDSERTNAWLAEHGVDMDSIMMYGYENLG